MCNVSRLRLEEEKEIAIFLSLFIIGKEALLKFCGIFEMTRNFILLFTISRVVRGRNKYSRAPPPTPFDSESAELFSNRGIEHPFPRQNSSSIDSRSCVCNRAGFSELHACQRHPPPILAVLHSPLANSSSISRSFSFADIDRYRAVEYRFDCLADRPSCDDTVFWRETGANEDDEDVEALDTCGMMVAIDMLFQKCGVRELGSVRVAREKSELDTRLWWGRGGSPTRSCPLRLTTKTDGIQSTEYL